MAEKKATKPRPQASGGVSETIDIDHELVAPPVLDAAAAAANPEEQIKKEIAKFNLADAAIAKLKETYGALVISGADDKEGYKKVREAWREVQSKRTGLEKKGLELRNQYKVITTAIGKEEDRLIDLLKPLEDELYKKWKAIDEEKEAAKKAQEAEEQRQLMARLDELIELGMRLRDGFYVIGDTISMDVATLRALPVDKYDKLKEAVAAKAAEIKAAEAAEAERKRKEAEDFQRQQDELKKQQEAMAEERRKMEEERQKLAQERAEASARRFELRAEKFLSIGMVRERDDLIYKSKGPSGDTVSASVEDVEYCDDLAFADLLQKARQGIAELEARNKSIIEAQQKEAEAKAAKEKFIAETLEKAGLVYNYGRSQFEYNGLGFSMAGTWENLLTKSEEEISTFAAEVAKDIQKDKVAQAKKLAADREEQKRQESLAMDDKSRYSMYHGLIAGAASGLMPSEYKTKKYQQRAQEFSDRLHNLLKEFE